MLIFVLLIPLVIWAIVASIAALRSDGYGRCHTVEVGQGRAPQKTWETGQ